MIYFIADTHFGHKNIIRLCNRPFKDIEEMNKTIIKNWNQKINGNDTVYVLGDMFFRCYNVEEILKQLNGKKHLIIGNHDSSWVNKVKLDKYFISVSDLKVISDGKRAITLCHYPMVTWKHQMRSYMIHGHIHNNTDMDFFPLLASRNNVLNAGVDINHFTPVTFDELLINNIEFKNIFLKNYK